MENLSAFLFTDGIYENCAIVNVKIIQGELK